MVKKILDLMDKTLMLLDKLELSEDQEEMGELEEKIIMNIGEWNEEIFKTNWLNVSREQMEELDQKADEIERKNKILLFSRCDTDDDQTFN